MIKQKQEGESLLPAVSSSFSETDEMEFVFKPFLVEILGLRQNSHFPDNLFAQK